MKKIIFTLVLISSFIFSGSLIAQNYSSAVGAKLTFGFLGTYKLELKEGIYADIYGGLGYYGLSGGAALELHKAIEDVDNLYWYVGAGAYTSLHTSGVYVGGNLVIGVDYSFDEIPLNVSFDWMPGINVVGGFFPSLFGGGLSARYILKSN